MELSKTSISYYYDGKKKVLSGLPDSYAEFQTSRDIKERLPFVDGGECYAVICGLQNFGNIVCIDWDFKNDKDRDFYQEFIKEVGSLFKTEEYYTEDTPTGGIHWIFSINEKDEVPARKVKIVKFGQAEDPKEKSAVDLLGFGGLVFTGGTKYKAGQENQRIEDLLPISLDRFQHLLNKLYQFFKVPEHCYQGSQKVIISTGLHDVINVLIPVLKGNLSGYEVWRDVTFALTNTFGEEGYKYLQELNEKSSEEDLRKHWNACLKSEDNAKGSEKRLITINYLMALAKQIDNTFKLPKHLKNSMKTMGIFWVSDWETGKVTIAHLKFVNFLVDLGYRVLLGDFVKVKDKVVYPIKDVKEIVKHVKSILESMDLQEFIFSSLVNILDTNSTYHKMETWARMLPEFNETFTMDDRNKMRFFFSDNWIEITEDGFTIRDYSTLNGVVWEKQIIQRYIKDMPGEDDNEKGRFTRFIELVTGENIEAFSCLISSIGYLMHTWKNPDGSPAIVLYDEKATYSGPAQGGTGKSLIKDAISKYRRVVVEDGRKLNFDSSFLWQKYALGDQIINLDDIYEGFPIEKIYNEITGCMNLEKKYRDATVIPFEQAPKFLLTSNYLMDISGVSDKRRIHEIYLKNYFNETYRVTSEFKHLFFIDWDKEEWGRFDHFMMTCCQTYLKEGLKRHKRTTEEHENMKSGALSGAYGEEFRDWFNENKRKLLNGTEKMTSKKAYKSKLWEDIKGTVPQLRDYSAKKLSHALKKIIEMDGDMIIAEDGKDKEGRYYIFKEVKE